MAVGRGSSPTVASAAASPVSVKKLRIEAADSKSGGDELASSHLYEKESYYLFKINRSQDPSKIWNVEGIVTCKSVYSANDVLQSRVLFPMYGTFAFQNEETLVSDVAFTRPGYNEAFYSALWRLMDYSIEYYDKVLFLLQCEKNDPKREKFLTKDDIQLLDRMQHDLKDTDSPEKTVEKYQKDLSWVCMQGFFGKHSARYQAILTVIVEGAENDCKKVYRSASLRSLPLKD